MQQRATEGITTTSGVDHRVRCHARHMGAHTTLPQVAALGAQRDDHAAQVGHLRQLLQRLLHALAQHRRLVVVDGHPAGLGNEGAQFIAAEHRQALARVEHEWNAGRGQLLRVADHRVAAIGGDDRVGDVAPAGGQHHAVGQLHRTGVKGGDLVVVLVGDDHALRRVSVRRAQHQRGVQAPALQPRQVVTAVVAQRGHHQRLATQQLQRVGDVAGTAAELAAHRRHQERYIQDVHLVGHDLLREAAREGGDGVEGE